MSVELTDQQVLEELWRRAWNGSLQEPFMEALLWQHRTCQQGIIRIVIGMIKAVAASESYDLRNEAAVTFCRQVVALIEEGKINDGLPLI